MVLQGHSALLGERQDGRGRGCDETAFRLENQAWKEDRLLEERDRLWAILANCNLGDRQSEIS